MTLTSPMVSRLVEDGLRDPDAFWARAAREVPWLRTWDRVFEWSPPTFRWFLGAETNLCTRRSIVTLAAAVAATPR